jgi:prephenate dehydrogenase
LLDDTLLSEIVAGDVFYKVFGLKRLRQISVIGMGLLGASVTLTILRSLFGVKTVGYSHRPSTRRKARQLGVAEQIVDDMARCVTEADVVILATPICTFEGIFRDIHDALKAGCIVTDVGSTKVLPHRWAEKLLPKNVHYVGSHPIAGSEKRGVEFARDDLFYGTRCILTRKETTNVAALKTLRKFWAQLGCRVDVMSPAEHDRIFGRVSHLPHVTAAALINASDLQHLKFAGRGFIDTSRVASGPENVWSDILITNPNNTAKGIDRIIAELRKLRKAIKGKDQKQIENLLGRARAKRAALVRYKMRKKELL